MTADNSRDENLDFQQIKQVLKLGITKTYQVVNQPDFPSFRIGRKIFASYNDVMEWQRKQIEIYRQEKSRV